MSGDPVEERRDSQHALYQRCRTGYLEGKSVQKYQDSCSATREIQADD